MSLSTFIQKAEALAVIFEKDMKNAAESALPITEKILAEIESPTGVLIENLIPNGAVYAADVIAVINAAVPAIKLLAGIGDTSSTKGLLQRLGSTITSIIHGGKHPFTYYVAAFEFICFGTVSPIVTPAPIVEHTTEAPVE